MTMPGVPMVGRYMLRSRLGKGGQGEVYQAYDTHEHCLVALKLLDPTNPHPGGMWVEAVVLRHLADPHILPIRNADQHLGRAYLVTEIAQHGTVMDIVRSNGSCGTSVDDVVRWLRHACYGVARAHDVGLVHNDLKPANLFLNAERECLVGDFGYAGKINPTSGKSLVFGGSKETVAPEVAATWGRPVEAGSIASDVYSLGASAAWMLVGRPVHDFSGATDLLSEMVIVATVTPPRLRDLAPHVPKSVADPIERAMAKDPADRYATVVAFASALGARSGVSRRWSRTDRHAACLACWEGSPVAGSTYVMCLTVGSVPKQRAISTNHAASGRRVPNGAATATATTWPRAVRRLMRDVG